MAIVPKGIRPFVKRTSIPAAKAAAQKWLASVTTATNAPEHRKSALRARLDYGRSLSRTTPMNEALSGSSLTPNSPELQDQQTQQGLQSPQTGQTGLPEGAETSGDNLNVEQYITILTILPQEIKQQPIRIVFTPPALSDFATKAQQSGMVNTASLVGAAVQGSDITSLEVETTAKSESQQGLQGLQISPPGRLNVLQSKIAQAQRNPFVNVNQRELAELYDLDSSSVDNLIGGGQVGA